MWGLIALQTNFMQNFTKPPHTLGKGLSLRGVVLIEALVAILILSFGMLGVAGLQINALSYQKSAWTTHRVAELTIDTAERIRANPAAAIAGQYVYTATYSISQTATPTYDVCRATGSTCSAADIAADDVKGLLAKAKQRLPEGAFLLSGNLTSGYEVTAIWKDKDSQVPPTTCSGTESGLDWRSCCPAAASLSANDTGVRCYRSVIVP
jgi:type IV pilus assembly protein PilV